MGIEEGGQVPLADASADAVRDSDATMDARISAVEQRMSGYPSIGGDLDLEDPNPGQAPAMGYGVAPQQQPMMAAPVYYGVQEEEEGCCETFLTYSLYFLIFMAVLLGLYWGAVTFEFTEDILGLGFGEDHAALWEAKLEEMSQSSSSLTPKGGRKMALIINVTYQDTQTRMDAAGEDESVALPGTLTDAKNMRDYLASQGFSVTWMRDDECKHSDTACSSCKNKKNKFGVKTFPNAKNIRNAMRGSRCIEG